LEASSSVELLRLVKAAGAGADRGQGSRPQLELDHRPRLELERGERRPPFELDRTSVGGHRRWIADLQRM
jgi:hypothetical protein